jgi:hypothetical protein
VFVDAHAGQFIEQYSPLSSLPHPFFSDQFTSKSDRTDKAYWAVIDTAHALHRQYSNTPRAAYMIDDLLPPALFRTLMGDIQLNLDYRGSEDKLMQTDDPNSPTAPTVITIFAGATDSQYKQSFKYNLVHEFGHAFDGRLGYRTSTGEEWGFGRRIIELRHSNWYSGSGTQGLTISSNEVCTDDRLCRQGRSRTAEEEWADMFMFWVYDGLTNEPNAPEFARKDIMGNLMNHAINIAYGYGSDPQQATDAVLAVVGNANISEATVLNPDRRFSPNEAFIYERPESNFGSSADISVYTGIPLRNVVRVYGKTQDGNWYLVSVDGYIGWMSGESIEVNSPDNLKIITPADFQEITGRSYSDNWDWR